MKKNLPCFLILTAAMLNISACGSSGSAENASQANASISPASTAVSTEGKVVAGAVFAGGVQSNNATPIKSYAAESSEVAIHKAITDIVLSRIVNELRYNTNESSQAKTITTSNNAQGTSGKIEFVNEKVSVGNGSAILNGTFNAEMADDIHGSGSGKISVKQEGVDISVLQNGTTYSEVVDGVINISISMSLTFTLNQSGQYNGYQTIADATFVGNDILVSGDISGSVLDMSAIYHNESVNDVNGTTVINETCSGYLSVDVSGEQAVCGLLSSCDGCEQL